MSAHPPTSQDDQFQIPRTADQRVHPSPSTEHVAVAPPGSGQVLSANQATGKEKIGGRLVRRGSFDVSHTRYYGADGERIGRYGRYAYCHTLFMACGNVVENIIDL